MINKYVWLHVINTITKIFFYSHLENVAIVASLYQLCVCEVQYFTLLSVGVCGSCGLSFSPLCEAEESEQHNYNV